MNEVKQTNQSKWRWLISFRIHASGTYAQLAVQLLSKSSGLFDRAVDKESPAKERVIIIMEQWHRRQKKNSLYVIVISLLSLAIYFEKICASVNSREHCRKNRIMINPSSFNTIITPGAALCSIHAKTHAVLCIFTHRTSHVQHWTLIYNNKNQQQDADSCDVWS